jgi:hypothetical protein
MNPIKLLSIITLFFSVPVCAQTESVINANNLYGAWNCKLTKVDRGSKIAFDIDVNYIQNGSANSFGTLKFDLPEIAELEYSIATSSTWEIKEGYLIETATEVKVVNISHPELDNIINLGSMFPQNTTESSKILELTSTTLSLKSENDEATFNCTKLKTK